MSEQELFERFRKEVADQLAPLASKISELSDEFKKLMHPDTGMYPRIRAVEDSAKRSHYRIDSIEKRLKEASQKVIGAIILLLVTVTSGVLIWFFTH